MPRIFSAGSAVVIMALTACDTSVGDSGQNRIQADRTRAVPDAVMERCPDPMFKYLDGSVYRNEQRPTYYM